MFSGLQVSTMSKTAEQQLLGQLEAYVNSEGKLAAVLTTCKVGMLFTSQPLPYSIAGFELGPGWRTEVIYRCSGASKASDTVSMS